MKKYSLTLVLLLVVLFIKAEKISGIVKIGSPLDYANTVVVVYQDENVYDRVKCNDKGYFEVKVEQGNYVIQYLNYDTILKETKVAVKGNVSLPTFIDPKGAQKLAIIRGKISNNIIIDYEYTVPKGDTLIMYSGSTILFGENGKLIIDGGAFFVSGTSREKTLLTAVDETVGWKGLEVINGGHLKLEFAEIRASSRTAITVEKASLDVNYCQINTSIHAKEANIIIVNSEITNNNTEPTEVSGIITEYSKLTIANTIIEGFQNKEYSPAIAVMGGEFNLINSNIVNNTCLDNKLATISITNNAEYANIYNNVFYNNSYEDGTSAIQIRSTASSSIYNNLFWNTSDQDFDQNTSKPEDLIDINTVSRDNKNNIVADPQFTNLSTFEFSIESPLVDAGENKYVEIRDIEYIVSNRIEDGNLDGEYVIDIGVSELYTKEIIVYVEHDTNGISNYFDLETDELIEDGIVLLEDGKTTVPGLEEVPTGDVYEAKKIIYRNSAKGEAKIENGKLPIVFPSPTDMKVCPYLPVKIEEANVKNYDHLRWTTTGSGEFSNKKSLKTVYYPSEEDYNSGGVIITITAYKGDISNNNSHDHSFYVEFISYFNLLVDKKIEKCDKYEFEHSLPTSFSNVLWNSSIESNSYSEVFYESSEVTIQADYYECTMFDTLEISIQNSPNAEFYGEYIEDEGFKVTAIEDDNVAHNWEINGVETSGFFDNIFPIEESGIYKICHEVSLGSCSDNICKNVEIFIEKKFNIGGQVFADGLPVTSARATLYVLDNGIFTELESKDCGNNGYYYFTNIKEGIYTVSVALNPADRLYGKYYSTCYGNVSELEYAKHIVIKRDSEWKNKIDLIEIPTTIKNTDYSLLQEKIVSSVISINPNIKIENVQIVSMTGEIILTSKVKQISVESLPEAMYLLSARIGENLLTEKFFIVR